MRHNRRSFEWAVPALALSSLYLPAHAEPPGYGKDTRARNLAHGRVLFTEHCLSCHETGRRRAPVLEETDDWRERLAQPLNTLIEHAANGHGTMPARSDKELSDPDVAAAVAHVLNRARR